MVTAQATDERVEDTSQRTEAARVFANPDGTWTTESSSEPERVVNESGEWHEIDTNLAETGEGLVPAASAADLLLSPGGDKTFATIVERGRTLEWLWPSVLPAPVVEGSTATYVGAAPGEGDLVVTATGTGFSHSVILHEAPEEPLDLRVPVLTDGAELTETQTGTLEISGQTGSPLVSAPRPMMWDASLDDIGEPDNVEPVTTVVGETAGGTPLLTLEPDQDFLTDSTTEYPVTVDPSFSVGPSGDSWVQSAGDTTGQAASSELRVGTYDSGATKARSFIHFDNGTEKWTGKHIISANLVLRNWASRSCNNQAIRASRITESWEGYALAWGDQPAATSSGSDDYAVAKGADGCPAGDASWNVAPIVQTWAGSPSTNHGIRLHAVDETSNNSFRRYRSVNYDNYPELRPKLEVTTNSYPNKPGAPTVTPGNPGYVTSATPVVKASVSDPDGGKAYAKFELHQGGTLRWAGTSPMVSSGSTAAMALPTLTNGAAYSVKAETYDGIDDSKSYSSTTMFVVDTSAPATVLTASGYTNGQWATAAPSQNVFTFNGPPDTSSFAYTLDGVNQPANPADGNGDATLAWLPQNGAHTLTVVASDKAGNAGPPATFSFGVGTGSFKAPTDSARSTGTFPIEVSGPPGATKAQLSWRYAGAGTSAWGSLDGVQKTSGGPWTETDVSTNQATGSSSTPPLVWDAASQQDPAKVGHPVTAITAPALIELRGCFTYAGVTAQSCTTPRQIQLVPSAFGGNFPVANVGPATVALFSGEATLTESDVSDSSAGISRTFSTYDAATVEVGPFGRGWESTLLTSGDTENELIDHREQDGTFVLVTAGNSSQTFTPADSSDTTDPRTYEPAGIDDGARLVLSGIEATLNRPGSGATSWEQESDGEFRLRGTTSSPTLGQPDTAFEADANARPTWISQTPPGQSPTCTQQVQEAGCRGLRFTYASNRVAKIERLINGTSPTTLATYSYVGDKLDKVCGGDPNTGSSLLEPLCVRYTYTTLGDRTLLASVTPPGQAPWNLAYDAQARLIEVKRPVDNGGTAGSTFATWTVRYDLSVNTSGLPDLSSGTAAQWGQEKSPIRAAAVFSPALVPANPASSSDLQSAELWYFDGLGTTTNTATHGSGQWLVDTAWYDAHGNVARTLDAAGRVTVLGAQTSERQRVAEEASTWTFYDGSGRRVEEELGPVREATLKSGVAGPYRSRTLFTYDDENTSLGGGSKPPLPEGQTYFDQVVEERRSTARPDGSGELDAKVIRYDYNPIVAGDGNGWTHGQPTRIKTQLADGTWSIQTTRIDQSGRTIETRQPGGGALADGSGSDARSTKTSYYGPDSSDPDCDSKADASRAGWVGLACKTGPAAQPTGTTMPTRYWSSYDSRLQATRTVESSGATSRVTTASFDGIGRPTGATVTSESETLTSATEYHPQSGLVVTRSTAGKSLATAYDSWGRVMNYTDATGSLSSLTYTADGLTASLNDGSGTYAYTYGTTTSERRRLPVAVSVGLPSGAASTFRMTYDTRGNQVSATYPNGLVSNFRYDESGTRTGLQYVAPSGSELFDLSADVDVDGRVVANRSPASEQTLTQDVLGRLTNVEDNREGLCTIRQYGFSPSSERLSYKAFGPDVLGDCQSNTPSASKLNTYDSANRIRNSGYVYDNLGRTLSIPASDTRVGASSPLSISYYANDMVKSLTQSVDNGMGTTVDKSEYTLDPAGRILTVRNLSDGAERNTVRYRFSGDSDRPSSIQTSLNAGVDWTTRRILSVPGLGMVGSVTSNSVTYDLANLHGDIVATQPGDDAEAVSMYSETDEYGKPLESGSHHQYGWLGTQQRAGDNVGGVMNMGARLYNPAQGMFTTPDAIQDGNLTKYGYPTDPCNQFDANGLACDGKEWWKDWATYWSGTKRWNSWRDTGELSGMRGWLRDQLGELYGNVPLRFSIRDKDKRYGSRVMLQRRCVRQNGRLAWQRRTAKATYAQYRWKIGIVSFLIVVPGGVWINGKESVSYTYY